MAPRAPKTAPGAAQEGPKRLIFGSRRGDAVRVPLPFFDRWALKSKASNRAPREPQEGPKRASGGARKPPRLP